MSNKLSRVLSVGIGLALALPGSPLVGLPLLALSCGGIDVDEEGHAQADDVAPVVPTTTPPPSVPPATPPVVPPPAPPAMMAPGPTTPPPAPGPLGPGTLLFEEFEKPLVFKNPAGWDHRSNPASNPNETTLSQDRAFGGSWGVKVLTYASNVDGYDHIDTFRKPGGYPALYIQVQVYIGADYVSPKPGSHQHVMGFNTTRGSSYLDFGMNKVSDSPERFSITAPWQDNAGKNQNHNDVAPPHLQLERGKWYRIEIASFNSATNGGTKLWVDGQLAIDHTGHNVTAWSVDSGWLGTCVKNAGIGGSLYFDNFIMSTEPIGPLVSP